MCPHSGKQATFVEGSFHYQQMKQDERVAEYINSNDKSLLDIVKTRR
ncbi:hypothetical protein [Limnobaculum parvum]|nr:hypothetical protein [Limnobaculum parvum]